MQVNIPYMDPQGQVLDDITANAHLPTSTTPTTPDWTSDGARGRPIGTDNPAASTWSMEDYTDMAHAWPKKVRMLVTILFFSGLLLTSFSELQNDILQHLDLFTPPL